MRPFFYQLEERIDVATFISVLAYDLMEWVDKRLKNHNDIRYRQKIRRNLLQIYISKFYFAQCG